MKTWLIWTLVAIAIIVVVYFLMKAKDKVVVKPNGTVVNGLGGRVSRGVMVGNKNIGGMNCVPVYNTQPDGTQWLASPPRWACPNGGIFDKNGNLTN